MSQIKIETLTPVHIGNGNFLRNKADFTVFREDGNSVIGIVTHGGIMFNLYEHFFDKQRVFANCEFFEIELDAKKIEDEYKKAVLK